MVKGSLLSPQPPNTIARKRETIDEPQWSVNPEYVAGSAWLQEGPVPGMALPELGKVAAFSEVEVAIFAALE